MRVNVCRMTQDATQNTTPGAAQGTAPGATGKQGWTAERIPDQSGRVAVVTGANSGLGLATARALAHRGGHVILAVRDEEKGRRAAAGITAGHAGASVEVRHLDLADLDSVRAFSASLHADRTRLDVLVNNAGLMAPPVRRARRGTSCSSPATTSATSRSPGCCSTCWPGAGTPGSSRSPRSTTVRRTWISTT